MRILDGAGIVTRGLALRRPSLDDVFMALTGHTASVLSVAMSPDGSTLATASADHTIRLWRLPRTVLIAHSGYVDGLVLDPSRDILVSSSADMNRLASSAI